MENKQRAMKMGIRANGNLGQHFQKQASKWDPICSRAYCKASQFGLPSPTILKTKVLKGETEHSQVWEKKNELTET